MELKSKVSNNSLGKLSKYRVTFIALIYTLLAIGIGKWLVFHDYDWQLTIAYCAFNLVFLVVFMYILSRIHLFYHSRSAISTVHLATLTMLSFVGAWSGYVLSELIASHDPRFITFLHESLPIAFFVYFLLFLVSTNQFWIDKHIIEQERTVQQLVQIERNLAKAELSNIQEQFRPHFVFNSLNSISALTSFDPEKAREMIQQLSDFLRASVKSDSKQMHSLGEELHYMELYLSIERVRFEDRLTVLIPDYEALAHRNVPVLILQPVLENAVKYGIYGTIGAVTIAVQIEESDEELHIRVTNPFDPSAAEAYAGKGYGLDSIRKKLYYLYQRRDLISISKTDDSFTVQLKIPQL